MKTFLLLSLLCSSRIYSQEMGKFSLGMRTTYSWFSNHGSGIGTGGQFRYRPNNHFNTEWFADYIELTTNPNFTSSFLHIGWSVLYYPIALEKQKLVPYIAIGHCFDYNKQRLRSSSEINRSTLGSAIQGGVGLHYFIYPLIDISFTTQFMIHLNKAEDHPSFTPYESENKNVEGHFLSTIGIHFTFPKKDLK